MNLERPIFPPPADQSASPGELYLPTDISPEAFFTALGGLRNRAEAEIERLLAFLDALDGDPDLEPGGDAEPELGSVSGRRGFDQSTWSAGRDREPALGAIEDHPDGSLCWSRRHSDGERRRDADGSQLSWADSDTQDGETEHDGREPDVDDEPSGDEEEPSLGSFDRMVNQEHSYRQAAGAKSWWYHTNNDLEVQPR